MELEYLFSLSDAYFKLCKSRGRTAALNMQNGKVKSKLSIDFTKAALANVRIHFMADTSWLIVHTEGMKMREWKHGRGTSGPDYSMSSIRKKILVKGLILTFCHLFLYYIQRKLSNTRKQGYYTDYVSLVSVTWPPANNVNRGHVHYCS